MRNLHLLLFGACLLLSGCITSVHPLSTVVKPDPLLLGDWKMTESENNNSLVHVTMTNNDWMQFNARPFSKDKPEAPSNGLNFVTEIDKKTYLNALDLEPNGWDGFAFCRYQFLGNNRVIFYEISRPILIAAIKSGKLNGQIEPDTDKLLGNIKITDSTENLAKFVKNNPGLFAGKSFQFDRITQ